MAAESQAERVMELGLDVTEKIVTGTINLEGPNGLGGE